MACCAGAIAAATKLGDEEVRACALGGLLHEIGKLDIPDAILFKRARLDDAEMCVMRTYCFLGHERLRKVPSLAPAAEIVYAHREKFDGSGHPRRLRGEAIPLGARIVAVACAFDTFGRMISVAHRIMRARRFRGGRAPFLIRRLVEILGGLACQQDARTLVTCE